MKRASIVVATAVGAGTIIAGFQTVGDGPLTYQALRQRESQEIPGTFGMTLEPPGDIAPGIGPDRAIGEVPLPPSAGTSVTLATVSDPLEGVEIGPAWVVMARGVCLRDAKGELVSDARGNDPNNLECTDATFVLVGVDAFTGKVVLNTTGYDVTLTWAPDVGLAT